MIPFLYVCLKLAPFAFTIDKVIKKIVLSARTFGLLNDLL